VSRISKRNRIDFFIVSEGDTYRSLEKEFGMMHWELFKYNDLPENFQLKAGMIMYIQPKRNKATVDNDFHIVKKGETMHSISQKYGIKLDNLYKLNRMKAGEKLVPGKKLWLRKISPQPSNVKLSVLKPRRNGIISICFFPGSCTERSFTKPLSTATFI